MYNRTQPGGKGIRLPEIRSQEQEAVFGKIAAYFEQLKNFRGSLARIITTLDAFVENLEKSTQENAKRDATKLRELLKPYRALSSLTLHPELDSADYLNERRRVLQTHLASVGTLQEPNKQIEEIVKSLNTTAINYSVLKNLIDPYLNTEMLKENAKTLKVDMVAVNEFPSKMTNAMSEIVNAETTLKKLGNEEDPDQNLATELGEFKDKIQKRFQKPKLEMKFYNTLHEVITFQANFKNDMRRLREALSPLIQESEQKEGLTPEERRQLQYFIEPLDVFSELEFEDPGVLTGLALTDLSDQAVPGNISAQRQAVLNLFVKKDSPLELNDELKAHIQANGEMTINQSYLEPLLQSYFNKGLFKFKDPMLKLSSEIIKPTQHAPRYLLLIREILKVEKELSDEGFSNGNEDLVNNLNAIVTQIKTMVERINEEVGHYDKEKSKLSKDEQILLRYRNKVNGQLSAEQFKEMLRVLNTSLLSSKSHGTQYLFELHQSLRAIPESLDDLNRMKIARGLVFQAYVNLYVDQRSKGITGTAKGTELQALEKLCVSYNLMGVRAGDKGDKLEARLLKAFEAEPEKIKSVVRTLFYRALAEGIAGNKQMIYVNVRKAITRMGDDAITLWNDLAREKLAGNPPKALLMAKGKMESESKDIYPSFAALGADAAFKSQIKMVLSIEMLIAALREKCYQPELIKNLESLAKLRDEQKMEVSQLVHQEVMKAYMDAHLPETVGSARPGFLKEIPKVVKTKLSEILAAIKDYHQNSGSDLFGTIKSNDSDQLADKQILHSIAKYEAEAREFARKTFEHALAYSFKDPSTPKVSSSESERRKTYLKDVQAVIEMGEPSVRVWNELAVQLKNPLLWSNLIIQNSNRKDERFEKQHGALETNKAFLEALSSRNKSKPYELKAIQGAEKGMEEKGGQQH